MLCLLSWFFSFLFIYENKIEKFIGFFIDIVKMSKGDPKVKGDDDSDGMT